MMIILHLHNIIYTFSIIVPTITEFKQVAGFLSVILILESRKSFS